jgi:hypothetical protein
MSTSRLSRIAAVAVATAILALPHALRAQGRGYGTVSVATAQGYDGNLLSTPQSTEVRSDMFTRVGPIVEGGYAWTRTRIGGRYSFDADRYRRHGDLNRLFARQDAAMDLRIVATPRLRFRADASYLATETPADLNLDTLLLPGRRPATRFSAASSIAYDATPVVAVLVGHTYTRDTLVGDVGNDAHASRIGMDYRVAARNTVGASYELRQIQFSGIFALGNRALFDRKLFHVVRGRWTHAFTPATSLELEGGPHIAEDAIRPEISAVIRRDTARGEFSVGYSREQTTTIGEARILDVHRIAGGGTFRPIRSVSLTVLPAVAYNLRNPLNPDETAVPVYTLDLESAFQASSRVGIIVTGRLGRQDGALQGLAGATDAIVDRRVMAQVVVTLVKTRWTPGEWPRVAGEEE